MKKGWEKINGSWYFLNREMGAMETGWIDDNGERYFLTKSGAMQTGWVESEGNWYYLGESGAMRKGWEQLKGNWYFLDRETGAMKTAWAKDKGKWYHMDSYGRMERRKMIVSSKGAYYLNSTGAMETGTFQYMKDVTLHADSNGLISMSEYKKYKSQIDAMEYARWVLENNGRDLWKAYQWCGTHISYRSMTLDDSLGSGYFANVGFNERSGNCYTMAGTFYFMALDLGYDAYQVSGCTLTYLATDNIHSWVEIYFNGVPYVYDPDVFQEFKCPIYGLRYGARGTLKYQESKNKYMRP